MSETGIPQDTDGASVRGDDVHVLLVDDDETWVSSTARILEHQREAFTVTTATDLAAASDAFAEDDPDCVVCDYQLDAGTGLDLLAEVRERDRDRPFILVTGRGDESVASDAIGRQVTDYIPKRSFGGRDDLLARRIEAAVDTYRTRQALARERRSKEAMLDILTATASREGLAREFCDHLVRERDYECAWIGTLGQSRGVVPQAAAGVEGYLDAAVEPGTTPETGTEPALVAMARREPRVVAPVEGDPAGDGWRAAAAAYGFESAVATPIDHDGTVFGVLAVYGATPAVEPADVDLLAEYGEAIGYALRSADWRESLLSGSSVAIDIELTDESVPLVAVDRRLPEGSRLGVLTSVVREGTLLYVLRVAGAAAADFRDAAERVDAVEDAEITRSDEPLRCELVVDLPTPETVLIEQGGRVVDTTVERGQASITTVGSSETEIQSLVGAVQSTYPDAGVRSVRSTDATDRRVTADELVRSLTDRQRRALELAFFSGYFERPRDHNTIEVAEKLGVSRQTLTQHLRAAQRKLLSGLLDPSVDR